MPIDGNMKSPHGWGEVLVWTNVSGQGLNPFCAHRKLDMTMCTCNPGVLPGETGRLAGCQPSPKFSVRGLVLGVGRGGYSRASRMLFLPPMAQGYMYLHTCTPHKKLSLPSLPCFMSSVLNLPIFFFNHVCYPGLWTHVHLQTIELLHFLSTISPGPISTNMKVVQKETRCSLSWSLK